MFKMLEPVISGERAKCIRHPKTFRIYINLERLWKDSCEVEDIFIDRFAETFTHERLHIVFTGLGIDDPIENEWYVRKLLGQRWDSTMFNYYAKVHGDKDE